MTTGSGEEVAWAFVAALGDRDRMRLADLLHDDPSRTLMSYEPPGPGTMDRASALGVLPELLGVFDERAHGWRAAG